MAHKNLKKSKDHLESLCQAFVNLQSTKEVKAFLIDLCTPAELRALSERWHVANLLDEGTYSYREINQMTGVSTTTIGRVSRFMTDEPYQGYTLVLKRQQEK